MYGNHLCGEESINPIFRTIQYSIILYSLIQSFDNMKQRIANLALVVANYDEAIAFYTDKLGFELLEDTKLSETKRWVRVAPKGSECCLLLAKADGEEQGSRIGNQTGGRVFLFLHTDDFWRDYHRMVNLGVSFVRGPAEEEYGTVAVFEDLYGNLWDLVQPVNSEESNSK